MGAGLFLWRIRGRMQFELQLSLDDWKKPSLATVSWFCIQDFKIRTNKLQFLIWWLAIQTIHRFVPTWMGRLENVLDHGFWVGQTSVDKWSWPDNCKILFSCLHLAWCWSNEFFFHGENYAEQLKTWLTSCESLQYCILCASETFVSMNLATWGWMRIVQLRLIVWHPQKYAMFEIVVGKGLDLTQSSTQRQPLQWKT